MTEQNTRHARVNAHRGRFVQGGLALPPANLPDPRLATPDSVYQDPAGQCWTIRRGAVARGDERPRAQYWTRAHPATAAEIKRLAFWKQALFIAAGLAGTLIVLGGTQFALVYAIVAAALAAGGLAVECFAMRRVQIPDDAYCEWRVEQRELARIRRGLPALRDADLDSAGGDS